MEKIQLLMETASSYVSMGLQTIQQVLNQYFFGLSQKWQGVLVVLLLLAVGFAVRGLIRSFAKNPRTTIFFIVLFAVLAAAWYVLFAFVF